ncbi:hypothetical protein ACP70R_024479 [Stipagrostis hirtigluma subsp. patula]
MASMKPGHAPGRDAVFWSDKMSEYLIDSLLHQQAIGNRGEGKFFTVAYDNIINGVGDRFGVAIDRSNIKNRLKHIKESFNECKNLFGDDSRIKWSEDSKRFHAEPHVWRELVERKPEAKKWMTKTIDHYDRLMELFGKDREKRPAIENSKDTPKKKARKEPPKERLQRSPLPNGSELTVPKSSNQIVNESEVPDEVVKKQNIYEELDLSESCRSATGIVAIPVRANTYGKGLPYAPENWPCPGDQWYWKVGCRAAAGGHWADRYLTPPSRFCDATGKKSSFASRLRVEEFIKEEFPDVDPATFFSMFIWKIPAEGQRIQKGTQQVMIPESESLVADPAGPCKARNKLCNLEREGFIESSKAQACNICCKEPGFCRECCCILCHRSIDYSFGGYSYIKCEAVVKENYICGHVAHLECALRCYMAGTVGGKVIDIDVQYLCRLCDNKTNLMMHVEELMETCQSLKSRNEIEPILNLGLCLLRNSRQTRAKSLENYMATALAKLKRGVDLVEVWKMEDDEGSAALSAANESYPRCGDFGQLVSYVILRNLNSVEYNELRDHIKSNPSENCSFGANSPPSSGVTLLGTQQIPEEGTFSGHPDLIDPMVDNELQRAVENCPVYIIGDHNVMSSKFEDEIDLALQELKKSQEAEYSLAEQKLYSQKDKILSLYRMLESERGELSDPGPLSTGSNYSAILSNVLNRVDQVKREEEKFKAMLKVAGGFGKTPKSVTQELFGLSADK